MPDASGMDLAEVVVALQRDDAKNRQQQGDKSRQTARRQFRRRQIQAAITDESQVERIQALTRARQVAQYGEVPEEDLQQRWNVTERLDIDRRDFTDQPVIGKAS